MLKCSSGGPFYKTARLHWGFAQRSHLYPAKSLLFMVPSFTSKSSKCISTWTGALYAPCPFKTSTLLQLLGACITPFATHVILLESWSSEGCIERLEGRVNESTFLAVPNSCVTRAITCSNACAVGFVKQSCA